MITPEAIQHLRDAAQKATQGKWEAVDDTSGGHFHVRCRYGDGPTNYLYNIWITPDSRNRQADLDYVAAANPQTILELLADYERLQKENEELKSRCDKLCGELVYASL